MQRPNFFPREKSEEVNPVRNSSPAIAGLETDGPFMNIYRSRGLLKILYKEAPSHHRFFSCGAQGLHRDNVSVFSPRQAPGAVSDHRLTNSPLLSPPQLCDPPQ